LKIKQALTHARECFVDPNLGLGGEERVQQTGLIPLKAEVSLFLRTEARERRESFQPLFRQQAKGSIAERHHRVSPPQRLQQLRQAYVASP